MQRANTILENIFGYKEFHSSQAAIIQQLLNGRDALVLMPTGGGKSLCYQIPSLVREGVGIVISPLIALMQDQVGAMHQLGVRAAFLNSSLTLKEAAEVEQGLLNNEYDLLYIAPERLLTDRMQALLERSRIALFAIDESHCVSQWGHDFRPEYQQLSILHKRFPEIPRIALTATADKRTRNEIISQLQLQSAEVFIHSFDRPNIRYAISGASNAKQQLWRFLENEHPADAGIVYCLSRNSTEEVADWLSTKGRVALPYHAGMPAEDRKTHQQRFLREEGIIIVATIAFGLGIDKPDVRFVAHLNLPKSVEAYYQETGRAGRDGEPANAWMVYGLQDVIKLQQFVQTSNADELHKRVEHYKLESMLGLCELITCRRHALLEYLGEASPEKCNCCDNCQEPPETWDATEAARMALSCVYKTGQGFGVNYVIDVLLGKLNERIQQNKHDQVSTYGIGSDIPATEWRLLFRQLIALGYLQVNIERHGILQLADRCRSLLNGEQKLQSRKQSMDQKHVVKTREKHKIRPQDAELWEALRQLRLELAQQAGVPSYIIFHDSTLLEMVKKRPNCIDEMQRISGIGQQKLSGYGNKFLTVIMEHPLPELLDNTLSDTVNNTLMLYQQGLDIENIARKREIKMSTVYAHLADAIEAGLLDARQVLGMEEREFDRIISMMEDLEEDQKGRLKSVYEALDEAYDYGVLRCIQAAI